MSSLGPVSFRHFSHTTIGTADETIAPRAVLPAPSTTRSCHRLPRCGRRLSCRLPLLYYDAVVAKTSGLSVCTRLSAHTPRPKTMVETDMATQ